LIFICHDIKDKKSYLDEFMNQHCILNEQVGYIGDDVNDLVAMELASFIGCPLDLCCEVKILANYISSKYGGHGAVRDVVEYILRERDEWIKQFMKFILIIIRNTMVLNN
jgi:3-deoxy-D-manno-octulosonate 8-phosphate phosphatase (KDO 8-P phosphatase)